MTNLINKFPHLKGESIAPTFGKVKTGVHRAPYAVLVTMFNTLLLILLNVLVVFLIIEIRQQKEPQNAIAADTEPITFRNPVQTDKAEYKPCEIVTLNPYFKDNSTTFNNVTINTELIKELGDNTFQSYLIGSKTLSINTSLEAITEFTETLPCDLEDGDYYFKGQLKSNYNYGEIHVDFISNSFSIKNER